MSSGSEARRSSQASSTSAGSAKKTVARAPSSAASARRRSSPARPSSRAALVLDEQHRRVAAVQDRPEARESPQVGRAAQRHEVDELDGRRPRGRGWRGSPRARRAGSAKVSAASGRDCGRASSCTSSSVNSRQRALRAGEQASQVGLGREQLGQVVARDAAGRARVAGGDAGARARPRSPPGRRASRPPLAPRHAAAQIVAARTARTRPPPPRRARPAPAAACPWSRRRRSSASPTSCCRPCRRWSPARRSRCRDRTRGRRRRGAVERALHDARLDPRDAALGIDLDDAVEVEAVDRDARSRGSARRGSWRRPAGRAARRGAPRSRRPRPGRRPSRPPARRRAAPGRSRRRSSRASATAGSCGPRRPRGGRARRPRRGPACWGLECRRRRSSRPSIDAGARAALPGPLRAGRGPQVGADSGGAPGGVRASGRSCLGQRAPHLAGPPPRRPTCRPLNTSLRSRHADPRRLPRPSLSASGDRLTLTPPFAPAIRGTSTLAPAFAQAARGDLAPLLRTRRGRTGPRQLRVRNVRRSPVQRRARVRPT